MDLKRQNFKKVDGYNSRKIDVFGVGVSDLTKKDAVSGIIRLSKAKDSGHYVVTVNAEFVMMAHRNKDFARILASSDIAVADGWWVANSKLISGGKFQDRITGVDLVENVCKIADEKAVRVGFLGGFDGVAAEVSKRQRKANPGLEVVLAEPGVPTISFDSRLKTRFSKIGRVDVLFVAYGMGKQEFWIDRFRKKVDVGVFIGVGGAFDYLAGAKKRAPKFLQDMGFEWLWRLVLEPTRIWRQRIIPIFFLMFLTKYLKIKFFNKIF